MAENFRRWESDPLYSAAEVVQDSADRMESLFRMLQHDQSLLQSDPSDLKLLSSIDYRRRDLATALGTTRWQLEDFERAVTSSALMDRSGLRQDAISKHKQLIRAIREQIIFVERSITESSAGNSNQNQPWEKVTEHDGDGFALFLSGADSKDYISHHDSQGSIMKRFLDSTAASSFDDKSDEIVELNIEESEHSKLNGTEQSVHAFDSLKESKLRKVESRPARFGFESSVSLQVLTGDRECENSFNISGGRDTVVTSKSRLKEPCSRIDIFGFLNRFSLASGFKSTRSFTKRRKDGEFFDVERDGLSPVLDLSQADEGKPRWLGLPLSLSVREGFSFGSLQNAIQSSTHIEAPWRIFQRLRYIVQYNRISWQLALLVFMVLILTGIMVFRAA